MILTFIFLNVCLIICVWVYCKLSCGICKCSRHLVGKVVIVTGGTSGIGYETAKDLADRGARVILTSRKTENGTNAMNKIKAATGNNDVHFKKLDLSSLSSVREFVENVIQTEERLDILINSAAAYSTDQNKTIDGFIECMQVNYIGPFLLTSLLMPLLEKSAPSRIVIVSSEAHHRANLDVDTINIVGNTRTSKRNPDVYANAKLCNILMATEFSRRFADSRVTCNALHPGVVNSNNLFENDIPFLSFALPLIGSFFKSPWEAAQTSIYLAVSPDVQDVSGRYFRDCRIGHCSNKARDPQLAQRLWKKTQALVDL